MEDEKCGDKTYAFLGARTHSPHKPPYQQIQATWSNSSRFVSRYRSDIDGLIATSKTLNIHGAWLLFWLFGNVGTGLPETISENVLDSGWNISESQKVAVAAKPYPKLMSAEWETKPELLWKMPRRVPPVLLLLDDITVTVSLYHLDVTLFIKVVCVMAFEMLIVTNGMKKQMKLWHYRGADVIDIKPSTN